MCWENNYDRWARLSKKLCCSTSRRKMLGLPMCHPGFHKVQLSTLPIEPVPPLELSSFFHNFVLKVCFFTVSTLFLFHVWCGRYMYQNICVPKGQSQDCFTSARRCPCAEAPSLLPQASSRQRAPSTGHPSRTHGATRERTHEGHGPAPARGAGSRDQGWRRMLGADVAGQRELLAAAEKIYFS